MNHNYNIQITLLENKKFNIDNGLLYVNVNEENTWQKIENNTVLAYETILLKIVDDDYKKTFYLFLKNTHISVLNNIVKIQALNDLHFFIKDGLNKKNNHKKELVDKYKNITNNILELEAKQQLGLTLSEFLDLDNLKQEQYITNMQIRLNLVEYKKDEK
ncbi:MSC_0621 family F1-like ATPase epsilon subunit [Ureaplasma urealyticum]|uniref:Uncharacterized protein n=3 Tax=Ureaplasma urealyticum TaxID=2130 RepID=A0AAP9AC42_UREUR|nr:hypothetical protein [Ureaplasma urealyticum]EDX54144.1 conserved hypothetical protein [Ureaplasma urealyticum serovar 9 str. ATCC 33175]ACI59790.1 conserved hypothetical protein [Ureaplasma urealyticum serovar 10 str. ATCC 33699]EDT49815.1 conserved hypothetical protein [Ureaplasma urealyticum serovar 13 str. ATCC 33698]EDU06534.1 conserved hypothetical protein [Ureaplasma urealyticum serovar 5 str. ATCC 27817]EDU67289.1 conserved hypothetical protein [Ureaplasma urealyticum serovar 11 str